MREPSETLEERVAALEANQVTRGKFVDYHRAELLDAAAKYANMKVFQSEITDDGTVMYCSRDAENMAEFLLRKMGEIAVRLLREMAKEEMKS